MDGIVKVQGRDYETVAYRIRKMRADHKDWQIHTDMLVCDEQKVIFKAEICDSAGVTIGTGHAEEFRGQGRINATNAVENAETSAIGRALATAGWLADHVASADEMLSPKMTATKPDPKATNYKAQFEAVASEDELKTLWAAIPKTLRLAVTEYKDAAKERVMK
jgi:hypothetical protein